MVRKAIISSLLCYALLAQQQQVTDPILKAMQAEMARSKTLQLMGLQPYFIEYSAEDQEQTVVSATLGGITNARQVRNRMPFVTVRVGSYEMDQTNQIYSNIYSGSRYDNDFLPLDENIDLMRQNFWLATDRAYKSAVESMSAKQQILKSINVTEKLLPDNQPMPGVVKIVPGARNKVDFDAWKARTSKLSAVFGDYPQVLASAAEFEALSSISYHLNTEGTMMRNPDYLTTMRIRAVGQAADGSVVRDAAAFLSFEDTKMAPEAAMQAAAKQVGENIKALVDAPVGESYSGPVLFEPMAAAQLFGQMLGDNLRNPRRPLSEPGRNVPFQPSELDGKVGSRILPDWFDVTDDPTLATHQGHALMGHYLIDTEAVPPKAVKLVEKGVLKEFLRTRQPIKGFTGSTGHARLAGNFGHRSAAIANLFVTASAQTKPLADLKKELIEMCKQRSKPYGILVRKMDYPSTASVGELQAMFQSMAQSGSTTRPVAPLTLVYRVYTDGREELIRNVRLKNVSTRSLRDILSATTEVAMYDYVNNNAPFALMGIPGYLASTTVAAPGVLFDELEIDRIRDDTAKPPVVPPPALR
ncbi:hypothetical protein F183_A10100 [Bryobacterales bacterium F-183]|nr:hypothetical protein F183_A10100 [Bryobacterales bacterium F-183]